MTEISTDPTAGLPAIIDVLLVEDDPGDVLMRRTPLRVTLRQQERARRGPGA